MPINLQGKEYVTHVELVEWATAGGLKSVSTELLHFDVEKQEAIVQATASGERGTYSGLGDCFSNVRGNVGRMVSAHWIRMAETRAINRALRLYTGRATTSIDELGERGNDGPTRPAPRRAEPRSAKPAPSVGDLQRELIAMWAARGIDDAAKAATISHHFDGATVRDIWSNGEALADLLALYDNDERER